MGTYPILFNMVLAFMGLVFLFHVYEIVFKKHYNSIPAKWRMRLQTTEK